MRTRLDTYRELLRDIPSAPGFADSIRLLDESFAPWSSVNPLAAFFGRGDDTDFFGRMTLVRLIGKDFHFALGARDGFSADPDEGQPSGLRRKIHQFAVVGFSAESPQCSAEMRKVILRRYLRAPLTHPGRPSSRSVRDGESVRLRAGLMNRRQAHLLAGHLNKFGRNAHFDEALNWRVLVGPGPEESPRSWLDAFVSKSEFLRQQSNPLADRGFGQMILDSLDVYGVEPAPVWHAEQVFSYETPRLIPPSRYEIYGCPIPGSPGFEQAFTFVVTRQAPDPGALELAQALRDCGCLPGEYGPWQHHGDDSTDSFPISRYWGDVREDNDGYPPEHPYSLAPEDVYARSLSRDEAVRAMAFLRTKGYRKLLIRKAGRDGQFMRIDNGNYHFHKQQVAVEQSYSVPGKGELNIHLRGLQWLTCIYDPPENWPEWERFAVKRCDEYGVGTWL